MILTTTTETKRTGREPRVAYFCIVSFRALEHLKGAVKQIVANFFANQGYIDLGDFPEPFSVKKT